MKPLYAIADEIQALEILFVDKDTGEFDEVGFAAALEELGLDIEQKVTAVAAFVLGLELEAKLVRTHMRPLVKRAKSLEGRAEWLRAYLVEHGRSHGKVNLPELGPRVSYGSNEAVTFDDPEEQGQDAAGALWAAQEYEESQGTSEFVRVKYEPAKDAIKEKLQTKLPMDELGELKGVEMETRHHVKIMR